jgi:hypothetical protein
MRSSRPNSATKTHIRIRNHAIKLYEVFCKDFNAGPPTCQCAAPHNVDLPLQRVSVGKEDHPEGSVKFTVLFSFEKWHEIDFESVDCQEEAHETAPNSSSLSDDESETDSNSRSTFSTLFSKFRGKSQTPPTILEAMERTCGDTTLYALAVSGSVNQNIRSKR